MQRSVGIRPAGYSMNRFNDPRDLLKGMVKPVEEEKPLKKSSDVVRAFVPGQLAKQLMGSTTAKLKKAMEGKKK